MATMLGEFPLGRLSDGLGRKPVIALGLTLFSGRFLGLGLIGDYVWIAVTFTVAGLGNALYNPPLSASVLDIAPAEHRARSTGPAAIRIPERSRGLNGYGILPPPDASPSSLHLRFRQLASLYLLNSHCRNSSATLELNSCAASATLT
jgi:MFS family permease